MGGNLGLSLDQDLSLFFSSKLKPGPTYCKSQKELRKRRNESQYVNQRQIPGNLHLFLESSEPRLNMKLKVLFFRLEFDNSRGIIIFCIKPAIRHWKAAHEPNLQSRPGLTEGRFFLLSGICRSGQFFLIICTAGSTGFVIRL